MGGRDEGNGVPGPSSLSSLPCLPWASLGCFLHTSPRHQMRLAKPTEDGRALLHHSLFLTTRAGAKAGSLGSMTPVHYSLFASSRHAHGSPDRSLCSSPAHHALNARLHSHQACMKSTQIWVRKGNLATVCGTPTSCGGLLTRVGGRFGNTTAGPSHLPAASAHAAVGRGAAGDGLVQGVPLALRLRLGAVSSTAKLVLTVRVYTNGNTPPMRHNDGAPPP